MAREIFLNDRREDADAWADLQFRPLAKRCPRVFLDIDADIPSGPP